jgi:hypothetical protein
VNHTFDRINSVLRRQVSSKHRKPLELLAYTVGSRWEYSLDYKACCVSTSVVPSTVCASERSYVSMAVLSNDLCSK